MEFKTKAQELGITEFPYREYDSDGNEIYWENKDGYWLKKEYDNLKTVIYQEDYKRSIGGWTSREREDKIKTVMECNPVIVEKNTAKIVNHSNE